MKVLRQLQLGLLRSDSRAGAADEDHRVVALFRNRAELKKAYGGLQEETFRLKDLIKQQEGATQRVQGLLSSLEGRLASTETAYAALVFYQLRRLWQDGRQLISDFIADLARRQEESERRGHLAHSNRVLQQRRRAAQQELLLAQEGHQAAQAAVAALHAERAALRRLWHYFRRRALEQRIAAAQAALDAAAAAEQARSATLAELQSQEAPEFPGLSLAARRAINLAAIAYAEVLCQRLAELKEPLVELAREATARREVVDEYGTPRECVLLMGQVARGQRLLQGRSGLARQISSRSTQLQGSVRYRGAADCTPVPDSIDSTSGDVMAAAAQGGGPRTPNVLGGDTWDLFRILLR
ncbi:MAG: hypothetical protein JSR67_00055 [Proteobacteria bacterium]|nr:hypothetical protein [Pseudomonadota bacterium]